MNTQEQGKATILVVDDEQGAIDMLCLLLTTNGYRTLEALSGKQALDIIERQNDLVHRWHRPEFDLVLMDIKMPGLDGLKVCQAIKGNEYLQHIPVLMVAALESPSDKALAVEFGADGYVTKPFVSQDLLLKIRAKLQCKAREEATIRRVRELSALNRISAAATRSLDVRRVMNNALDQLIEVLQVEATTIYLLDRRANVLNFASQRGLSADPPPEAASVKIGQGVLGRIAQAKEPMLIEDISQDAWFTQAVTTADSPTTFVGVPLRAHNRTIGVVSVYSRDPGRFDENDIKLLEAVGQQVGVAIENAQLFEETQALLLKSGALSPSLLETR